MAALLDIEKAWAGSEYVKVVLANAGKREGLPCRLHHDPINGVTVVCDRPELDSPVIVELSEDDKTLLLIATGRAFAKLLRL